jgi:para-aminobenzoate synthetase component 1
MPASVVPLVEELVPCPDPWDVARKLSFLPNLLFLDSADRHPDRGRYSYVTADPGGLYVLPEGYDPFDDDVFQCLRVRRPDIPGLPPFLGGWAGLFGYGLGRAFERVPGPRANEFDAPGTAVGVYDWVISFDHATNRAWIVSTGILFENFDIPQTLARAGQRLADIRDAVETGTQWDSSYSDPRPPVPEHGIAPQFRLDRFPGVSSNFSRDGYIDAVRRAVEYVHAGDVFQVNLSQRLLAPLTEHPLDLYGRLRQVSPAPFGCYFDLGDFQIASASPERFLQLSADGEVSTRPIKGTRPRGKTPAEDAALLRDLTTNPKDRAENVMIVDLLRNDLGRVCEYGSVRVPIVCEVESFRQVHHLVSEVRGKLRPGKTAFDLLRAAFPGGSVTGAPKVRAMEIIAELEPTARGPYCGSVGWVGFDGAMDTNILIRTFTAGRGWLQFPVGGGIVADSDPATEYEETLHKAAGLLRALQR